MVYSGGGSENSLVKISPQELQKANQDTVLKVNPQTLTLDTVFYCKYFKKI